MNYVLVFLEGIITFISPCILPMLPIYLSYFAGQKGSEQNSNTLVNALGFVTGFTILFTALGAFAGQLGSLVVQYQTVLNIVCGFIIILLGLNFTGIIRLPFININRQAQAKKDITGFFSAMTLGVVFSVSWTPCVGTFLGSALMLAANSGSNLSGIFMLLVYSLGLGIPFILSAIFIDKLESAFQAIKKHYRAITIGSGTILILTGLLIATGWMNKLYGLM